MTESPRPREPEGHRIRPGEAFATLSALKEKGFNVLVDLTAVDYSAYEESRGPGAFRMYQLADDPKVPGRRPVPSRFELVYRLMSLDPGTGLERARAEVRCPVEDGETVPRSSAGLWPIADWLEREVWDMFGIRFADRPDIKRLLLYEEFRGHPLRKDYPIAKRQPLIGPPSGEPADNPSFNAAAPAISGE